MENASKALIMAASVLLGIMIISVGIALFNSFSEFGSQTINKMEETKISEWNNKYLKYYGENTYTDMNGKEEKRRIQVTAHDIVSVANSAKQNNINYELQEQKAYNENTYYLQVQVGKDSNFEKRTEEYKNDFLKENSLKDNETKYYICTDIKTSETTKRVMYIRFDEEE